jgi:RNA polymerase-associated protein CTR9
MATTAGTILIPVHQSTEVIEVQISELPDDVGEVQEILMNELAPLEVWLRFAVEYYRQGKHDSFLKMFQPLLDEEDRGNLFVQFGDTKQTREQFLAILNALPLLPPK